MNWLLDLILAAFIVLIVYIYAKRGCTAFIDLISQPVTFISAFLFGPKVGEAILGKVMLDNVTGTVLGVLRGMAGEGQKALNISELFDKMPESFSALLTRTGSDAGALEGSYGDVTAASDELLEQFASKIAAPVASTLSSILGTVMVFAAVFVLFKVLRPILGGVLKLPFLKQANEALGIVVGIISAFVYTWIICVALGFVIEYGLVERYNGMLSSMAESSYILRFFCNISLVDFVNIVK